MSPISFPPTTGLEFDWAYPEPLELSYMLAALEAQFENPIGLTTMLVADAREDMQQRFLDEVDPEGEPWAELVKPAKNQVGILRRTEDLYHSAISESAWTAAPGGLFFDTSALPSYWAFHEQPEGEGGQRIARRAFIGLSEAFQAKMVLTAESWLDVIIADSMPQETFLRSEIVGPSWGQSAAGKWVFGTQLGSRGFVPVGRGAKGFVSLHPTTMYSRFAKQVGLMR